MQQAVENLIERVRAEGQVTRNSGTNSIKSVKAVLHSMEHQLIISSSFLEVSHIRLGEIANLLKEQTKFLKSSDAEAKEDRAREDAFKRPDNEQRVGGNNDQPVTEKIPTGFNLLEFLGLGLFSQAIASSIGASIGLVTGQLRAISVAFNGVAKVLESITPNVLKTRISKFVEDMGSLLSNLRNTVTQSVNTIRDGISSAATRITNFFRIDADSAIARAFAGVRTRLDLFADAIETIRDVIRSITAGPLRVISSGVGLITGYFASLGRSIGVIGRVVSRIFAPIAIILAGVEAIQQAVDGYAEDGLWGALEGAVRGLLGSLIAAPLDLLTDGVAWILDRLGFDRAAEFLGQFSWRQLFDDVIGGLFDTVDGIVTWVRNYFSFDPDRNVVWNGLSTVQDLLLLPINAGLDWIRTAFGWSDPENPIRVQDVITEWANDFIEWLGSFLPDISEIGRRIQMTAFRILPPSVRNLIFDQETIDRLAPSRVEQLRGEIAALDQQLIAIRATPIAGNNRQAADRSRAISRIEDQSAQLQAELDDRLAGIGTLPLYRDPANINMPIVQPNGDVIYPDGWDASNVVPMMPGARDADLAALEAYLAEIEGRRGDPAVVTTNSGNTTTDARTYDQRTTTIINHTSPHRTIDPAAPGG